MAEAKDEAFARQYDPKYIPTHHPGFEALGKPINDFMNKYFNGDRWFLEVFSPIADKKWTLQAFAGHPKNSALKNLWLDVYYKDESAGLLTRATLYDDFKDPSNGKAPPSSLEMALVRGCGPSGAQRFKLKADLNLDLPAQEPVSFQMGYQMKVPNLTVSSSLDGQYTRYNKTGGLSASASAVYHLSQQAAEFGAKVSADLSNGMGIADLLLAGKTGFRGMTALVKYSHVAKGGYAGKLSATVKSPAVVIADVPVAAGVEAEYDLKAHQPTNLTAVSQLTVCPGFDLKLKMDTQSRTSISTIHSKVPGNWLLATSFTFDGTSAVPQVGMQFTNGSRPLPL